jgi:hypothetical protein
MCSPSTIDGSSCSVFLGSYLQSANPYRRTNEIYGLLEEKSCASAIHKETLLRNLWRTIISYLPKNSSRHL